MRSNSKRKRISGFSVMLPSPGALLCIFPSQRTVAAEASLSLFLSPRHTANNYKNYYWGAQTIKKAKTAIDMTFASEINAHSLRLTLASRGGKATANSSVILVLSSSWVFFSFAVITWFKMKQKYYLLKTQLLGAFIHLKGLQGILVTSKLMFFRQFCYEVTLRNKSGNHLTSS